MNYVSQELSHYLEIGAEKDGKLNFNVYDQVAFQEAIGFEFFQEVLDTGTIIQKKKDFDAREPYVMTLKAPVK